MEGSLSLVIFTLLGQASAGMVLLLPFFADPETGRGRIAGGVALALLCAGALFSLGHLSDPWVSFYTITNAGTSWLSREIWFVGLLGAATLAWLVTRRAWIRWLAALVGLGLVYVMSRVYTLPTVPFWNSAATFWTFLASGLLTGAATLLFLNGLAARRDPEAARRLATGDPRAGLRVARAGPAPAMDGFPDARPCRPAMLDPGFSVGRSGPRPPAAGS